MQENALRQQQQMAMFDGIGSAIDNLVGGFVEREENKARVKSGETFLKMFGDQMGIDTTILSSPEYKSLGLRGQADLHSGILGNVGAISQLRMAGMRAEQAPVMQAQRVTDQREIMYEREQLARERQAMSSPPPPAAITVPPAMRRFGNPNNP
jgi:hypothetical protein